MFAPSLRKEFLPCEAGAITLNNRLPAAENGCGLPRPPSPTPNLSVHRPPCLCLNQTPWCRPPQIRHPHIVNLLEVMSSRDKIFMVLELVTGGELFDKIVAEGPMKVGAGRAGIGSRAGGVWQAGTRQLAPAGKDRQPGRRQGDPAAAQVDFQGG